MSDTSPRRLSSDARSQLLNRLRGSTPAQPPKPEMKEVSYDTSFETLPGYEEIQMMRTVGEAMGVKNPFFRAHDGTAGALTSIEGREVLNFASYDYLCLNSHPQVRQAARDAVDQFGSTVSASRLVAGERPFHRALEADLAAVYDADDAITFVSGHAANVTTIGSLLGPDDIIFHDALIHNSVIVGAELSRARRRVFPHNNLEELERLLEAERSRAGRALIVIEGVYSMDGDLPDLVAFIELKKRFGAWLMVDEAHALGVLGQTGKGIAEHTGIDPAEVDIWMGTLSKSLAACGGYIAGKQALVDWLRAKAPGFVYSVGLAPPVAAAASASLKVIKNEPDRVARLQANSKFLLEVAQAAGLGTGDATGNGIVPVMIGDSLRAVMLAERLLARGINVLPIIYPAVPQKAARLRFFITSEHTHEQLKTAATATAEELAALGGSALTSSSTMDGA